MAASLHIAGIRKVFGKGDKAVEILKKIDIEVAPGEFLILVGPSGCGKSTLLNIIAGLEEPTEGELKIAGKNVVGVAPAANLYAVKVLNKRGVGFISDLIEGLEWSAANNMQVINMSLGLATDVPAFHDAVQKIYALGITQVAAAGNSGPATGTVTYPARYPEVIAVSAIDEYDDIAYFSSRGPEIDLAAPGVRILSTFPRRSYRLLSGTSMAAPHVTGTATLVLAAKGPMTPADMLAHLQATAEDLGLAPDEQGAGLVDAMTAAGA
jgi:subtilisin